MDKTLKQDSIFLKNKKGVMEKDMMMINYPNPKQISNKNTIQLN